MANAVRTIRRIIWHCAATPEGRDVSAAEIRFWHVEDNGWGDIGYHYVIRLDGSIEAGRPEATVGAHVKGHNADSIGICYVGGVASDGRTPKDTRTPAQRAALYSLTADLIRRYPGATVHGHNEFAAKACPSFDAAADWRAHVATPAPPPSRLPPTARPAPSGGFWAAIWQIITRILRRKA